MNHVNCVNITGFRVEQAMETSEMIYRVLESVPEGTFTKQSLEGNRSFYMEEEIVKREGGQWQTFLAVADGKVAGCVSLSWEKKWLYGLWVDPEYQKMNIGRALVEHLIEAAKSNGVMKLGVFSVMPAKGFYEKFGFETVHHQSSEEYGELDEMHLQL